MTRQNRTGLEGLAGENRKTPHLSAFPCQTFQTCPASKATERPKVLRFCRPVPPPRHPTTKAAERPQVLKPCRPPPPRRPPAKLLFPKVLQAPLASPGHPLTINTQVTPPVFPTTRGHPNSYRQSTNQNPMEEKYSWKILNSQKWRTRSAKAL